MSESPDHEYREADRERKLRRVLKYWFWGWPALGGLAIAEYAFDSSAFRNCPHILFMFPLIGMATTRWTLFRTRDSRYLPQLLASVVLLGVGKTLF